MPRGFTLLELIISLLVAGVLLAGVGPNFSSMYENYRMKKVATEIQGALIMGRSEAVMRNNDASLKIIAANSADKEWELRLSRENSIASDEDALLLIKGSGVTLSYQHEVITFEGINGKPLSTGHIAIAYRNNSTPQLYIKYHKITGRIWICGHGGKYYGYPKCES